MTYASVDDVKRFLLIPLSDNSFDAEIQNILSAVDLEINAILNNFYSNLPLTENHDDYNVVKNYETMWAAGLFKMRRDEKYEGEHPLVKTAREALLTYLRLKHRFIQKIS